MKSGSRISRSLSEKPENFLYRLIAPLSRLRERGWGRGQALGKHAHASLRKDSRPHPNPLPQAGEGAHRSMSDSLWDLKPSATPAAAATHPSPRTSTSPRSP
ncbi:conserved protein of unknown function [Cupriavidus taiwanensis]|uniref:Uncharacterized protein n=1 Tax=Cupriavidus taiwanensis TaxID=164546 RepID=A0A375IHL6_9BURK|nr:conserved hypothetical protein [Cupriavidus taiwanensis]SOY89270.1 conserved hypothetical protein [Cupriavidus taiwanensis]SOZ81549.1 conserved hypothetical protein [Cupriavidus taiwanensis]SPA16469.1 conserved hypothetical protein [Cupriavidus taiwanensis]SPK73501.1 conserved protein of unknown function [Cupriavidus taiwanensis]